MEVQCPNCQSKFHLPDAAVRPNAKLRCSVCQNVFRYGATPTSAAVEEPAPTPVASPPPTPEPQSAMPAAAAVSGADDLNLDSGAIPGGDSDKPSGGKKSKLIISILVLLLCIGGGAGGWWYMNMQKQAPASLSEGISPSVELMTMSHVRQYYVKNEKIGDIFVVEGNVINKFPVPKELIEVEAAIYASDKTVLKAKKQLAGTSLSLFQLQVLGEDELETFLNNEIEILTKNTNVPPDGVVPFMVLFYNPPSQVSEFGVKILSAKDVKAQD